MPKSESLIIRRVEAIAISMPLLKPVLMGGGQKFTHSESLIVRMEAANGVVGWGEASAAPSMTGDTLPGMVEAVDQFKNHQVRRHGRHHARGDRRRCAGAVG
jgi:muconate cycloisomerase